MDRSISISICVYDMRNKAVDYWEWIIMLLFFPDNSQQGTLIWKTTQINCNNLTNVTLWLNKHHYN